MAVFYMASIQLDALQCSRQSLWGSDLDGQSDYSPDPDERVGILQSYDMIRYLVGYLGTCCIHIEFYIVYDIILTCLTYVYL